MDPIFLKRPLGERGVPITDAGQAELSFVPSIPSGLGVPEHLEATPLDTKNPLDSQIAWVFDHVALGHFAVFERATAAAEQSLLEDDFSQAAACSTTPASKEQQEAFGEGAYIEHCTTGVGKLITIQGEVPAVLVDGSEATNVIWQMPLEPTSPNSFDDVPYPLGVEIRVVGFASDFSVDQAIAVAEQVR